ncbi:MAG: CRTAC1 family protein [Planctomycetaceae bacterium]
MSANSRTLSSWISLVSLFALLACVAIWEVKRQSSLERTAPTPAAKGLVDCPEHLPQPDIRPVGIGLKDVTTQLGVHFHHVIGPLGTYFMPESIGCGGALADFNGDGSLDLFLVNAGQSPKAVSPLDSIPGNQIWLQTNDGMFVESTVQSALGDKGYGSGCAVGDVNNDNALDVFVSNYGCDQLYLNDGTGRFENVTESVGIAESAWGTCAAFFDYDRDGWLDLIVINYTHDPEYDHSIACGFRAGLVSYCGPHKFQPTVDCLYHNDGYVEQSDGSMTLRFTDVTEAAGLSECRSYGFGVLVADYTRDGWPDIFVANDGAANLLWVNQKDGTFIEEGVERGVAYNERGNAEAGMGTALGDVNGDGTLDLVVSHLSTESTTLYLGGADGSFVDSTKSHSLDGPTMQHTGWGVALVDLNHDGFLDCPMVNGLVVPCHSGFPFHGEDEFQVRHDQIDDPQAYWLDYADRNVLMMGHSLKQMESRPELGGDFCAAIGSGRSLIHGDIDSDGDVDLVVTNCGGPAKIYRNELVREGHWLIISAWDPVLKRDAYGAEITLEGSGKTLVGLLNPAGSYLASNEPVVHFGLGEMVQYDRIRVRWPDGPVETSLEEFDGGVADRRLRLIRGEGRLLP